MASRSLRILGPTIRRLASRPSVVILRHKNKGARLGSHRQTLDEMAHAPSRKAAEERRQKKKDKRNRKESPAVADDNVEEVNHENDDDDDADELPDPDKVKELLQKHMDSFHTYLKGIRGGEPTVEMFDDIAVADAYGPNTGSVPLKSLAQVVIQGPTMAVATCYDPSTTKAVRNAIRDALELNPSSDNGAVEIPIPRASLESRQTALRNLQKRAEDFRQRIRNTRRKVMNQVKKGVNGKLEGISKDDAFRVQQEIESVVETYVQQINDAAVEKEEMIMDV